MTKFLEDARARHLTVETVRKYQNLRERRFVGWSESKGYRLLKQIDVAAIREFRTTWESGSPSDTTNRVKTLQKKLEDEVRKAWS